MSSTKFKHRLLLLFIPALLFIGIGVQFYASQKFPYTSSIEGRSLADLLPSGSGAWTLHELPIASSDAAVGNVEKILRYDDVVFRRYQRGDIQVDIYAAYWLPGKMSYWDVGSHNPDSCWVYNGFERKERVYAYQLQDSRLPLKPFEFGRYEQKGSTIDVMFWHLVGGQPNRYKEQPQGWRNGLAGRIERFPLMLKDISSYGLDMHREQLFVRISANRPLRALFEDAHFRALLLDLKRLGVITKPVSQAG